MGDTTEQVAHSLGDKTAGLLNATMGNAIEVIVGIVGVKNGWYFPLRVREFTAKLCGK